MDLEGEVGDAHQRRIGAERGDHVRGRPDVDVVGGGDRVQRVARRRVAEGHEARHGTAQARLGEAPRLVAVLGHEDAARADDAGGAPWRQGVEIGVDDRVLDRVERQPGRVLWAGLRTGQEQTVAGFSRPASPVHREVACQSRSASAGAAG